MYNSSIFVCCLHVEPIGDNERGQGRVDETLQWSNEKSGNRNGNRGGCKVVEVDGEAVRYSDMQRLNIVGIALSHSAFCVLP